MAPAARSSRWQQPHLTAPSQTVGCRMLQKMPAHAAVFGNESCLRQILALVRHATVMSQRPSITVMAAGRRATRSIPHSMPHHISRDACHITMRPHGKRHTSRVQGACTPLRIDTGASPAAGAPPIDYTNQSATLRPTCDRPLCRTLFRLLRITRKGAARRNCLL